MSQGIESFLIWLGCLLGFGFTGVICTFFPGFVQRIALDAPPPKWKFIPKPEDMWPARSMGGRRYFEGRSYRVQIRLVGLFSLIATALLILVPLGVFR